MSAYVSACMPTNTGNTPRLPSQKPRPDLPSDKAELNKLVRWFYRHDGGWLADALWLRYTKIAKVVYSDDCYRLTPSDRVWKLGLYEDFIKQTSDQPPMPYNILPEIQPRDGLDRLSGLSEELRFEILSYLLLPNIRVQLGCLDVADHPLNSVASVSKAWRDQVDAFCSHALLVWKQRVKRSPNYADHGEPDLWVEWRALKCYTSCARMEYVFRTRTCCVLCGTNREHLTVSTDLGMMWCSLCRKHALENNIQWRVRQVQVLTCPGNAASTTFS